MCKNIMSQARFWNNVNIVPQSNSFQCWEWQAAKLPNGYGIASIGNGETMLAHRYVASLSSDITNQIVLHTCDNPLCVRPDHLIVGTQQDNINDMIAKSRKYTKLSIQQVRDIRTKSHTRKEYATKYSISLYTVGEIQRNQTWKWIK